MSYPNSTADQLTGDEIVEIRQSGRVKILSVSELLDEYSPSVVALTDAATIDLTGPEHTLTTSTGRTFMG